MTPHPMNGRRVLALGASLAPLSKGPLAGASVISGAPEALARMRPGDFDLILLDADAWPPAMLADTVALLATLKAPPMLTVGERLSASLVRSLLKLPASDILEAPYTDAQIASAIAILLLDVQPATETATVHGRCWAVTGAVGGAGATTVAVEVATALAARATRDRSVCLIDLNLADGACAAYLGAQPAMRLGDFGTGAERIDAAVLQAFVTPISKSLDLLAAARDPAAFEAVPREAVLRLLEVACEAYDWVIVDIPRHRQAWTIEALTGCDEVVVVSELTVPALLAARALSDEIEAAMTGLLPPRIVLNRLANRMFGPAPSMGEAERALQRKAEAGIASDWEAAAASVNLGGPIAQHRPKSKVVRDIAALVDRLAAAAPRPHALRPT